ncbi:MAG: PorT family protein [Saprospiraceae bacterium]|nr:PorT family protein [Saprospiraceae bacterium]
MKTRIILFFAFLFMLSAFLTNAQTSFAILGGVNLQNLNGKDYEGDKLENDLIIGFHAGLNAQIPIATDFYFQPGLLFSTKGAKNEFGQITSTFKLSYIELPLNLVYKPALGSGYIMLGFGPYVGYGITGKSIVEGSGNKIESDIEFTNTIEATDPIATTYFKALDAGANFFFGYEMAMGVFVQLNAQLGLIKINPEDKRIPEGDTAVKNTGFGLSVGYRF